MVILLMNERICFAYINEPRTQTLGKFTHTHARTHARARTHPTLQITLRTAGCKRNVAQCRRIEGWRDARPLHIRVLLSSSAARFSRLIRYTDNSSTTIADKGIELKGRRILAA